MRKMKQERIYVKTIENFLKEFQIKKIKQVNN